MPIPSPIHPVTAPLCTSMRWKDWAGYYAVCSFDTCSDREYFAFRHAAGLIDVSPLFKYDVTGPDAGAFLAQVMSKDVSKLKPGQITYCCWCDEQGYVIDDGTVWKISATHYRVTAAEPTYAWLERYKRRFQVVISDVSAQFAALSLQGPHARFILCALLGNDVSLLPYFRFMEMPYCGSHIIVSRTGYTGDLGFELWTPPELGPTLYQDLLNTGKPFGILACGLDAMDMTRIEAGFIMNGVDYYSANHCMIDARKSSPFELGLDWCVQLDRDPFIGQAALKRAKLAGPKKKLVGLDIDWVELEQAFAKHDLPPEIPQRAWRDGKPIYDQGLAFVGFATSGTWSPTLKKNLALAHVKTDFATLGTKLKFEVTVEYERTPITATVVETPFLNLERKRS